MSSPVAAERTRWHAAGDSSIARLRTAVLRVPLDADLRAYGPRHVNVLFVEMSDTDGRTGTGFTYTFGPESAPVRSMVDDVIAPLVIGVKLRGWQQTYRELRVRTRRIGRHVFLPAISAVDIAAWDLQSRILDLPLYRFLGRSESTVPIYGSGRSGNSLAVDELVAGARAYVDEGYSAMKLRVGARTPEEDLERLGAVRDAVGDRARLMIDCNERLDLVTALWLSERVADLGVYWIEEPLPAEQLEAYTTLAARSRTPLATGEHLVAEEFEQYAQRNAVAVFQPDVALAGGITAGVQVCALASTHGVSVSLHSLPELHVQLATGDPNVCYVEHFPILDRIMAAPLKQVDGTVTAPARPGHGILWDWDAIAANVISGEIPPQVDEP